MKVNPNLVVTSYEEFRKLVCEYVKKRNTYLKTQEEIEKFIDTGGGDGIIEAMYDENKQYFAKGLYVHSKADAAAMNVE